MTWNELLGYARIMGYAINTNELSIFVNSREYCRFRIDWTDKGEMIWIESNVKDIYDEIRSKEIRFKRN